MSKQFNLGIILSAKDAMSGKLGKASKSVTRLERGVSKLGVSMTRMGMASIGATAAIAGSLGKTVSSFQEVQRAKGELASLDIGEIGLSKIGKEAQKYSNTFAGTTKAQFISAAYDIKSGISSLSDEGVAKFTSLASMTGAATKSTSAEMTKLFALGYGIFRKDFTSDFDFGEKFSASIAGAVKAFRTDGSDLVLGLSNIGKSAATLGVSLQEELSIIGVAKGAYNSAAEAGTGYKAFLNGVGKAQKKLGLDFKDSQGHLIPMVDIMKKIKNKFGDLSTLKNKDLLTTAFGGGEATNFIAALVDKTDDLTASQDDLNKKMAQGSAVTKDMALKMNRGKEFEILGQQVNNATSAIGSIFAPTAIRMGVIIGKTTKKLTKWIETHKEEANAIGKTVVAIGAGLLAFGTFSITLGLATSALGVMIGSVHRTVKLFGFLAKAVSFVSFNAFKIGLMGARIAMGTTKIAASVLSFTFKSVLVPSLKIAGRAVLWLGRAFMMNPIGIAVAAIAGAAYLIYANWGKIKPFFTNLWTNVKSIFVKSWENISSFFSHPIESIKGMWSDMTSFFGGLWDGIVQSAVSKFDGLVAIIKSPIEGIKKMWSDLMGFVDGKMKWFHETVSTLEDGWKSTKSFFGFDDEEGTNSPKQKNTPNLKVVTKRVLQTAVAVPALAAVSTTGSTDVVQQTIANTTINQSQSQGIGDMKTIIGNQQMQIKSNNDIIAAVAGRPEQHTYHVTVTIHNPRNTQEIEGAVMRAMKSATRKADHKKLGDIE